MAKPPVFTPAQRDVLGDVLRQLRTELATERDQAITRALQQRCLLSYQGTFDATRGYVRGDAITDKGAVFCAICDTAPGERPGSKSTAWRLIAKGGADGPTFA